MRKKYYFCTPQFPKAQVAELVDAHVSGACAARRAGSIPVLGTWLSLVIFDYGAFLVFSITVLHTHAKALPGIGHGTKQRFRTERPRSPQCMPDRSKLFLAHSLNRDLERRSGARMVDKQLPEEHSIPFGFIGHFDPRPPAGQQGRLVPDSRSAFAAGHNPGDYDRARTDVGEVEYDFFLMPHPYPPQVCNPGFEPEKRIAAGKAGVFPIRTDQCRSG